MSPDKVINHRERAIFDGFFLLDRIANRNIVIVQESELFVVVMDLFWEK